MTEHLPECPVQTKDSVCRCLPCICDALRACEARVTAAAVQRVAEETEAAMMQSFHLKPSPPHDQHYFVDNICAYCVGRREALDAAAQRVAALSEYVLRDTCVSAIEDIRKEEK